MGFGPFAMAGKFLKGESGGRGRAAGGGERREGRAAGGASGGEPREGASPTRTEAESRKRKHGSGRAGAEGRERKHGLGLREGSGRGQREGSSGGGCGKVAGRQREGSGRGQAPPVRRGYARKRRAVSEQIGTALRYCSWFPNTQGEELQNKNGLRCLLAGKSWREGKSLPCVWMRVSGG
jgi:hypothetical protein